MAGKEIKKIKRKRFIAKLLIDVWGAALIMLFFHFILMVPYRNYCGNVTNWQLIGLMTFFVIIFALIVFSVANAAILLYMMADLYFSTTEEIMSCDYCVMTDENSEEQ